VRVKDDEGVWSAPADDLEQWFSCTVYVFTMDLDISGVSEADEEDPGGYIGQSDLVEISLSYEPSTLDVGYAQLSSHFGGQQKIRVWDGETMIIGDSDEKEVWPIDSMPSTLDVQGYSVGSANLWLYFTPDQPPWYPGGEYNYDLVHFTVYNAELKNIWFASDHGSLKDNNSDWTDSGTTFSEPEWVADPWRNNPISHTKNTSLEIEATVKVEPSGLKFDLLGDGPQNYLDFSHTNLTSTGSDQVVTMTAHAALPNQVDTLTGSINWTILLDDPNPNIFEDVGTSGSHKIYVTYGTPSGSVVTEKRLSWACEQADGASTEVGVADGIHNGLGNVDPPREPGECDPGELCGNWLLMAGCPYYGECDEQATLMELGVELLGVSAYTDKVYASSNSGAGNCLDLENQIEGGIQKWLILDFNMGPGYNWNAFEGCCVAGGSWYAVWPKKKATDDYDMLKNQLSPQQYWVSTYYNTRPGDPGWEVQTVYDEEPLP